MMADVCCLLEVRWRGQGYGMLGKEPRRFMLTWSGNGDGVVAKRIFVRRWWL